MTLVKQPKSLHYDGAIADTVDRLRQISHPHPREPLRQGLDEGGVAGFYSIMSTGKEKNYLVNSTNLF
jgi:hypothetical protein